MPASLSLARAKISLPLTRTSPTCPWAAFWGHQNVCKPSSSSPAPGGGPCCHTPSWREAKKARGRLAFPWLEVCVRARVRVVSRWPEMGVGGCGEKAPGQGLCQSRHGLALLPEFASVEFATVRSGCPGGVGVLRLLVRQKAQVWNGGYRGKRLEWKASDLCFSLALPCGPGSVTAPLWDSVPTSEKARGLNSMSSEFCGFQFQGPTKSGLSVEGSDPL